MTRKHNFNAGPSVLPLITLEELSKASLDFNGIGMSILEISHRSKEFEAVMTETTALFKELLNIPDGYHVLFLGGGASTQFCMVPYNLMNKKSGYLVAGEWGKKAHKEAKFFGDALELASSADKTFSYIPKNYTIPEDLDYFHITTNNTIFGTEIRYDMDSPVPLVADMSSDIFSRPVDVSKYVLIYGGAQKNLAPAGVTFVIVKEDALGKVERPIPTMLNYQTHINNQSMFNTPPVFAIYGALITLRWLKNMGGLKIMQEKNETKAKLLYDEIDRNPLFVGTVAKEDRSVMNICFIMNDGFKELEDEFSKFCSARGMVGFKGHRSVGGFRCSTYNALPIESVQAMVDAMKEFEKLKG